MTKDVLDDPTLGLILQVSQAELLLEILALASRPYVTFLNNSHDERDQLRKLTSYRHDEMTAIASILSVKLANVETQSFLRS